MLANGAPVVSFTHHYCVLAHSNVTLHCNSTIEQGRSVKMQWSNEQIIDGDSERLQYIKICPVIAFYNFQDKSDQKLVRNNSECNWEGLRQLHMSCWESFRRERIKLGAVGCPRQLRLSDTARGDGNLQWGWLRLRGHQHHCVSSQWNHLSHPNQKLWSETISLVLIDSIMNVLMNLFDRRNNDNIYNCKSENFECNRTESNVVITTRAVNMFEAIKLLTPQ